jgi:hypothetical protein
MPIHNRPVFTDVYENLNDFSPVPKSVYVFGKSVEERSQHVDSWQLRTPDVSFVRITREERSSICYELNGGQPETLPLRSTDRVNVFWQKAVQETIYLDITGLRHHVWAALLRGALATRKRVAVVYVEPEDYRPSLTLTENEIYDLSERIEGIAPLPGFARLRETGDNSCFVPLLGFEGTRVSYLIDQLEPPGGKIIPVIGVPGFRPEYPFASYLGNRRPLLQTKAWKEVRYAVANCPFDHLSRPGTSDGAIS